MSRQKKFPSLGAVIKSTISSLFHSSLHKTGKLYAVAFSEEVILAEERTTEEERNHIMEARKRAANKRRKMQKLGKSRSTETEEEDEEPDEGRTQLRVRNDQGRSP